MGPAVHLQAKGRCSQAGGTLAGRMASAGYHKSFPWHKRLLNYNLKREETAQVGFFPLFWPWNLRFTYLFSVSKSHCMDWVGVFSNCPIIQHLHHMLYVMITKLSFSVSCCSQQHYLNQRFYKFRNILPLAFGEMLVTIFQDYFISAKSYTREKILAVIYNML